MYLGHLRSGTIAQQHYKSVHKFQKVLNTLQKNRKGKISEEERVLWRYHHEW